MKKLLLFILLLIIPITVNAAEASGTLTSVNWHYKDGVLTFTTDNPDQGYRVSYVTYTNGTWYAYKDQITKIVIGDGIDVIEARAFENYPNLEEVILPDSMGGYIDDYAFYNCSKIKSIKLPTSMTRIGDYAFYGTGIEEVELSIYLDWTYEHTFNENTTITKQTEENLVAAGTSGKPKFSGNPMGNGNPTDNTCYNKFYYAEFYDDTGHWKLYEDGTLIVSGSELVSGYYGSRNPWGCYKQQIKKIIINDDAIGEVEVKDNICGINDHVKLAVYASKPIDEIMQNRIKILQGQYLAEHRDDPIYGYRNLDSIVINRGVEEIGNNTFFSVDIHPNDIYINKYVNYIHGTEFARSNRQLIKENDNNLHISVSYDDYKNNDYKYYYGWNETTDFFKEDGTIKTIEEVVNDQYGLRYDGQIVSDVDDTYVSINDDSAPDTIEVDGKTYYKYETYLTNSEGIAKVSVPNDETIEYYVKEIDAPTGCMVSGVVRRLDTSKREIELLIETNPEPEPEVEEQQQENPLTGDFIMILGTLFILSFLLIIYNYRKGRKLI